VASSLQASGGGLNDGAELSLYVMGGANSTLVGGAVAQLRVSV